MKNSVGIAKAYYAEEAVKEKVNPDVLLKDGCFILELLCKYEKSIGQSSSSSKNKEEVNSGRLMKDGCFILKLLCTSKGDIDKSSSSKNKEKNMPPPAAATSLPKTSNYDPIFGLPMMQASVRHDLLLLENQLPFFVLEDLFRLTLDRLPGHLPLVHYLTIYFQRTLKTGPYSAKKLVEEEDKRSPTVRDQQNDQHHLIDVEKEDRGKDRDKNEGKGSLSRPGFHNPSAQANHTYYTV